jgi:hypothetical protein
MNLKKAALSELNQIGRDVLRGDNPINRIAVPGVTGFANKITGRQTSIDSVTLDNNVAPANAGTALPPTRYSGPVPVSQLGTISASPKTLTLPSSAATSTPPAPPGP